LTPSEVTDGQPFCEVSSSIQIMGGINYIAYLAEIYFLSITIVDEPIEVGQHDGPRLLSC
jgi:hypothetical protein